MSILNSELFTPWTKLNGVYSIYNVATQKVLDQENSVIGKTKIGCRNGDPSLNISNPNQLWMLVNIGDDKWLVINKRTGKYLAAPDPGCSTVSQKGHPDWPNAHWRISPTEEGSLSFVVFLSLKNPGECLELEGVDDTSSGNIKIAPRDTHNAGQIWCLKKQS